MYLSRRKLLIALLAVTAWYAWGNLSRGAGEIATLSAPGGGIEDRYARVWVVQERPYYWIRAEKPTRRWLESIYENPEVVLHVGDERLRCTAEIREDRGAVEHVNALFRAKYGLADEVREAIGNRQPVPVRLLPR